MHKDETYMRCVNAADYASMSTQFDAKENSEASSDD